MISTFKVVSGDFAVKDWHGCGGEKDVEDAELEKKRPQYNERHDDVTLQHDNTRPPHVAKVVVKKYLETLKWEILAHPPYSPGVAPYDFHLTHLVHWRTAWFTITSARKKK
nr:hypothetical transcript [Hymenolepis microstoma]